VLGSGAGPTSSCQRLGKVCKVDVYSEVCLAGAVKRVRECVTLKGLYTRKSALCENGGNF
jgi:hypothetical protein